MDNVTMPTQEEIAAAIRCFDEIETYWMLCRISDAMKDSVVVPKECEVKIDREGVLFGKHFWASHESITGKTAEGLRRRTGLGAGYMEWIDAMLAAAKVRG